MRHVSRLSLAHHVDHFDAGRDDGGGDGRLEAEHRSQAPLDSAMILLDQIVEGAAPPDADPLQTAPAAILQAICGVAG
jgi:hypothetical protein